LLGVNNEDTKEFAGSVFHRVVGKKEDPTQTRDPKVWQDVVEESKSVCGVQDGQGSEN
jgi:hypothetical protein